ncbi:MAG: triose-phosphate isomerase [Ginsengibacter sp.]
MRKQIAAANWKMNLDINKANELLTALLSKNIQLKENQEVVLGIPFPYLIASADLLHKNKNYFVAAQNCYSKNSGAYTGEVSPQMLKSINVDYVIIGHSERREYFNESHEMLSEKINICFENNLKPIFCCGEPLSIREANEQNDYVTKQLKESIFHLDETKMTGLVIAYEPIWAIGTGRTATSDQAQEMHAHIRNQIALAYSDQIAQSVSILYGGSVKAANAVDIFGKT